MSKHRGFTLIEMLLVMVIISMVVVMGIGYMQQQTQSLRIAKTSLQMQQILNAGLAYYVVYGQWPNPMQISELQSKGFLPNIAISNPWGQQYAITQSTGGSSPSSLFYVYTSIPGVKGSPAAFAAAAQIAGKLPLAYTTATNPNGNVPDTASPCDTTTTATCYVTAAVNIPGQNLNNASALNFAGVYNHGACVPAPTCPLNSSGTTTMTPEVFIVPISVSGLNDANTATPNNVYPISSFTAYPSNPTPQPISTTAATPTACTGGAYVPCAPVNPSSPTATYWRACLQIITEKGDLSTTSQWGNRVKVAAFTRCSPNNEPSGSGIGVFSN